MAATPTRVVQQVTYVFGDCELDDRRLTLSRGGQPEPVEPQVFDLLHYLIRERGRVVTKEELLDELWGDRFVSESALTTRIRSARRAVGDDGTRQSVIRTAHGRGYEFIAEVVEREDAAEPAPAPAAATPDEPATARRLPAPVTELIGRDDILDELEERIDEHRFLTLIGPGGVGKTALAYGLARRVEERFRDGVYLVGFARVEDAGAAEGALATALDVHPRQTDSVEDAVVEMLSRRHALLALDNCEHLLDALSGTIERILASAADITIVATSREPFSLPGENVWPVDPLPLDALDAAAAADSDGSWDLDDVRAIPPVALFVQRARAVDPHFDLDDSNVAAVSEICRRLDGIPLAIELAAARIRSLDAADIAGRLDERFRLLRGVRRGVDPRHHTLLDAVRWSYDLLDDEDQDLFSQMSVFAGPFDLAAAEAVCGPEDGIDLLDGLTRLAERSMLNVRHHPEGGTRYELLETLRAYGRSRLPDEDSVGLYARHADHHAELAHGVSAELGGHGEPAAMTRARRSLADTRAALRFAVEVGDHDTSLGLVSSVREFAMRSMRYEPLTWAADVITDPATADHPLRPIAAGVQAYETWVRGEFPEALTMARAVQADEARLGLAPCGLAERVLANVALILGDIEEGLVATRQQLASAEDSGDLSRVAHALYMHSVALASISSRDDAAELAERCGEVGERTQSPTDIASAWVARGFAARSPDEALTAFTQCQAFADRAGNRWMSAFARTELGVLHLDTGDTDRARELLADVVDVWFRAGEWSQQWHTMTRCVVALVAIDAQDVAARLLGAIETRAGLGTPPVMANVRDQALDSSDSLRATLGTDRFEELYALGAQDPIVEVVRRTRGTLIGRPVE